MRAVQVTRLDGPDAVALADVPEPQPAGEVLIDVHAAGVTFPDVLLTRGEYQIKPDLPFSPGSEVAGVVRSAPDGAGVSAGDRVVGFPGVGGFRDVVGVDSERVFPLPEGVSFETGAGIPMNYLTAHFALRRRGQLATAETVLVHGAAGGVGTATVQLARALGAHVIAVVSDDAKGETARRAGAHEVVTSDGFRDAVKGLTEGRGVDIVVDPVGGDRFTDSLRCLSPEGRLLVIGFTAGEIPTVKVNRLLLNNIDVRGVGWGAFALSKPGFAQQQWGELLPHIRSGAIDPPIGGSYPVEQAADAIKALDERRATGKVLITFR